MEAQKLLPGQNIASNDNLFLKVGNEIKTKEDYTFSIDRQSIILNVAQCKHKSKYYYFRCSRQNVLDYGTLLVMVAQ